MRDSSYSGIGNRTIDGTKPIGDPIGREERIFPSTRGCVFIPHTYAQQRNPHPSRLDRGDRLREILGEKEKEREKKKEKKTICFEKISFVYTTEFSVSVLAPFFLFFFFRDKKKIVTEQKKEEKIRKKRKCVISKIARKELKKGKKKEEEEKRLNLIFDIISRERKERDCLKQHFRLLINQTYQNYVS